MAEPIKAGHAADHAGAMVALALPEDVASKVAVTGGEAPDVLHVTLAYFEDAAADRDDWGQLAAALEPVIQQSGGVVGRIGGQGFFDTEQGRVHWLPVDAPELGKLRETIVSTAQDAGFPVSNDHGFQPHITLAYADAGSEPPEVDLPGGDIEFGWPNLWVGGDKISLAGAKTPVTAALTIDGQDVPLNPPGEWFAPPAGGIPTDKRLTIEAGGRVYGYIALWNACHVGAQGCVPPPKGSPSEYRLAHPGITVTAEGEELPTGNIGGDVGHAGGELGPDDAAWFYENTATQIMRVRYGEDENGLWFAGALWPTLTDEDVARARANSISGDWRWDASWRRTDGGGYDFTGAVLVPQPGFPLEAEGGVSTESGWLDSIAASVRLDEPEFRGIVSCGNAYLMIDDPGDETVAGQAEAQTAGGGCGCGGKQAAARQIKAGTFVGTVDDFLMTIARHIEAALDEVQLSDDAPSEDAEPSEVDVEDLAAAIRASLDETVGGAPDLEALHMKVDTALDKLSFIENATIEAAAEKLAAEAIG